MIGILDILMNILSTVHKIWGMIPPEKQEEIKTQIMDWFEVVLRSFFRNGDSTSGGLENV